MIIKKFLEYLTYERRFSNYTVKSYETDLKQFYDFIAEDNEIAENQEIKLLTYNNVRNWIVFLKKANQSPASINRKISSLKSFTKYLIKIGKIENNPLENISALKNKKRLPEFVKESQMNKLEDEKEILFTNNFSGKRDEFILELFYNTGIRLSELINIKHKDFDFFKKTIKVLGKRNKERIIPINEYIKNIFSDYILFKEKENFSLEGNSWLFVTNKGQKMYPKFVYLKVIRYLSEITELKKRSPHILRHTFATHMLNNGADLNAIKEILGHSSLAATQIYTHNTFKKIKEIYNKAHPRS
ncbi:MAG: tyrosine-type recombinase/integrase [Bacteroidales bacterium]|jgi:integrase/recombinase XerC|nr:tyrosine-type recombinase/integrase [Bacteroidales bacterium]